MRIRNTARIAIVLPVLLSMAGAAAGADYRVDEVEHARQTSRWSPRMYEVYDYQTYGEFEPFGEEIDLVSIDYPLLNAALFYESNRARAENGLPPLRWNLQLEITAYNHSLFMVDQFEFAHYSGSSARRSPGDRAALAGVTNPQIQENLGINFALDYIENTPFYVHGDGVFSYDNNPAHFLPVLTYREFARRAVDLWMDSFSHRRNLLSEKAVQMGTGAFFFREANAGYFPKFRTTQNFQWFTDVIPGESLDPLPPGYRLEDLGDMQN
jgi:uncharacterized protein YkwD